VTSPYGGRSGTAQHRAPTVRPPSSATATEPGRWGGYPVVGRRRKRGNRGSASAARRKARRHRGYPCEGNGRGYEEPSRYSRGHRSGGRTVAVRGRIREPTEAERSTTLMGASRVCGLLVEGTKVLQPSLSLEVPRSASRDPWSSYVNAGSPNAGQTRLKMGRLARDGTTRHRPLPCLES
jgi:hypothetical protein